MNPRVNSRANGGNEGGEVDLEEWEAKEGGWMRERVHPKGMSKSKRKREKGDSPEG